MKKAIEKQNAFEPGTLVWKENLSAKYPFHPVSMLFPMMSEEEFAGLIEDMKTVGQLEKIILFEGQIADGRNRFKACLEAGIEPRFETFEGSLEELEVVVASKNMQRRHLDWDQKKALVIDLRKKDWSQEKIAQAVRISIGKVNEICQDNFTGENTGTKKDALGRNRPTSYKKREKTETEEEKLDRLTTRAREDLDEWAELYGEDLGALRLLNLLTAWTKEFKAKAGQKKEAA